MSHLFQQRSIWSLKIGNLKVIEVEKGQEIDEESESEEDRERKKTEMRALAIDSL
jgi:hypothetical protein